MGKIVTINTAMIRPSQNYLKAKTLRYILTCLNEHRDMDLPPTPMVRRGRGEVVESMSGRRSVIHRCGTRGHER